MLRYEQFSWILNSEATPLKETNSEEGGSPQNMGPGVLYYTRLPMHAEESRAPGSGEMKVKSAGGGGSGGTRAPAPPPELPRGTGPPPPPGARPRPDQEDAETRPRPASSERPQEAADHRAGENGPPEAQAGQPAALPGHHVSHGGGHLPAVLRSPLEGRQPHGLAQPQNRLLQLLPVERGHRLPPVSPVPRAGGPGRATGRPGPGQAGCIWGPGLLSLCPPASVPGLVQR